MGTHLQTDSTATVGRLPQGAPEFVQLNDQTWASTVTPYSAVAWTMMAWWHPLGVAIIILPLAGMGVAACLESEEYDGLGLS